MVFYKNAYHYSVHNHYNVLTGAHIWAKQSKEQHMDNNKQGWFQLPINRLQMLIIGVVMGVAVASAPLYFSGKVKEYEYDNVRVQKDIVEKRVSTVEDNMYILRQRVEDSEFKINAQVAFTDKATRKLEGLMYEANPRAMSKLAQAEAEEARARVEASKRTSVIQNASPVINVNPTINNGGGK
ncbi:hypothetical protein SAMN04490193_3012 [Pseudomonas marginalis]|nr:hypothetical protein SAMN04490193_3012 [Pseudomonas marginalis]